MKNGKAERVIWVKTSKYKWVAYFDGNRNCGGRDAESDLYKTVVVVVGVTYCSGRYQGRMYRHI